MGKDKKQKDFKWIFWVSIGFLALFNILYIVQMGGCLSKEASDLEAYGSFIGGALGSLFTFLSIIVLVFTFREQSKTNAANIKLLKKQLTEQKTNHKENINLLNTQLSEQKKHNDKTIKFLIEELSQNKEFFEKNFYIV